MTEIIIHVQLNHSQQSKDSVSCRVYLALVLDRFRFTSHPGFKSNTSDMNIYIYPWPNVQLYPDRHFYCDW